MIILIAFHEKDMVFTKIIANFAAASGLLNCN